MYSKSKSFVVPSFIKEMYTDIEMIELTLTKYLSMRSTRWRSSEYTNSITAGPNHITSRQMLEIIKSLIHEQLSSNAVQ
jgi:hypothetical protein